MKDKLTKKSKEKWFAAPDRYWEEGWFGPHPTIEAAILECFSAYGENKVFVAKGHKLTKAERYSEFEWEVQTENALEVKLP